MKPHALFGIRSHHRRTSRHRTTTAFLVLSGAATSLFLLVRTGSAQAVDQSLWVANGPVKSIVRSAGTIYIGGSFTEVGPATGSFLNIDAASGTARLPYPMVVGTVSAMAPDGNGGWFVGGTFTAVRGQTRGNLAHVDASGNLTAWAPIANGPVNTVIVSGSIVYVGGSFTSVGGQARNCVAALDAISGAVTSWDPNADGSVNALAVSGSAVYIGGAFNNMGGQVRLKIASVDAASGTLTGWNPTSFGSPVLALAVSGATVYVGGQFVSIGGQNRNYIAALDAASGAATSWNPNADGPVRALVVSGGSVYVGGTFTSIGGQARNHIAALDPVSGAATTWNPNANQDVRSLAAAGSTVYAGGDFTSVGGQTRNHIAALDGSAAATNWNPNADGPVLTLAASGSEICAGGSFTTMGEQARSRIAAFDAATGAATGFNPGADGGVNALALSGNVLYVGGTFTNIGGQPRNRIAALDATTGAVTSWDPNAEDGPVNVLALRGNVLYVGGDFTRIAHASRFRVAALDATSGTNTGFDPVAVNGSVSTLAVSGSTLYIAGVFTSVGGQARNHVAALDATTGTVSNWNPNANQIVDELTVSGNTINVGGDFVSVGGQPRNHIAALDAVSGTATGWNPNADARVLALALDGGTIRVGGSFTSIGGQARNHLAEIDLASGQATGWDPNANGSVFDLVVNGSTIYAGGAFSSITTEPQSYFAAISPCATSVSSFSPVYGNYLGSVTITGTRLDLATGVRFNGTSGAITAQSSASITATVPSGATAGPIEILAPCGATSTEFFYPPGWPTNGVPVNRSAGDQASPASASDDSGGVIVTWKDHRGVDYDIYAQRMNPSGQPLWPVGGVPVCTAPEDQINPVIVSDGAHGAIIAWDDHRSSTHIYAQHITSTGLNAKWGGANGVALELTQGGQPAIVSDGAGGAIVAWSDLRNEPLGGDIYARRVNSTGVPQWAADGVPVCLASSLQQAPTIISDGANGAIIGWMDYRAGLDLYAQRLDGSGTRLWTTPDANGVPVCTAAGDQTDPVMVPDGTNVPNGAIIAWNDHRNSTHIFAQRITSTGGNAQWGGSPDGVQLEATQAGQPAIASDGAGGAIVAWSDLRNEPVYGDIYARRVNSAGVPQWAADGVAVCLAGSLQQTPTIISDGANGAILCWWDYRAGLDLYAQRLDPSGAHLWTVPDFNGVPVCTAPNDQNHSVIVGDGAGGAIVAWQDARSGAGSSDLYAVRVRSNGFVTDVPAAVSQAVAPALAWPNPFRSRTSIAFTLSTTTRVHLEVFDVGGRRVWVSSSQLLGPGRHSLAWNGQVEDGTAAGGVYFLRVRGAGVGASRTVIRMN